MARCVQKRKASKGEPKQTQEGTGFQSQSVLKRPGDGSAVGRVAAIAGTSGASFGK